MTENIQDKNYTDIIKSLSPEEKQKIFSEEIDRLEKIYISLQEKTDDRFNSHEEKSRAAMQTVISLCRKITGYNCGWVPEEFIKHCSNSGRDKKYDSDTRLFNSIFIDQMIIHGSSQTQAAILLAKLTGDLAVSEGFQKEIRESYAHFCKSDIYDDHQDILNIGWAIGNMLKFDLSMPPTSKEAAFSTALKAFKDFWQNVIDQMKASRPVIEKMDAGYPAIFGCVIEWLDADYENPLDYFYIHPTHQTVPLHDRQYRLSTYIESMNTFKNLK